jgi:DnaK suppressor protein
MMGIGTRVLKLIKTDAGWYESNPIETLIGIGRDRREAVFLFRCLLRRMGRDCHLTVKRTAPESVGNWMQSGHESVRIGIRSRLDHPLNCYRIPPNMNKHEEIAKALKARLSELTSRVAEIDGELRKPLPADSEERATYLENQDAFEGIGYTEIQEIQQIRAALKQIAGGTYGVCAQCGADIDPKRLKALPYATRCISCAA